MGFDYVLLAAGLAVALMMERAVLAWAPTGLAQVSPTTGGLSMRPLAWQAGPQRAVLAKIAAIAAAVVVVTAALRFDELEAVRVAVLCVAMLVCAATDLLAYRVPDAVTLPSLAFTLACSVFGAGPEPLTALAAAAMAGGLLLVAAVLTRGGLGGGDVKLGVLIGAALGLPAGAFALAAGIVAGGVLIVGLYAIQWLERDQAFPFAPFLALAAVAFLLAG